MGGVIRDATHFGLGRLDGQVANEDGSTISVPRRLPRGDVLRLRSLDPLLALLEPRLHTLVHQIALAVLILARSLRVIKRYARRRRCDWSRRSRDWLLSVFVRGPLEKLGLGLLGRLVLLGFLGWAWDRCFGLRLGNNDRRGSRECRNFPCE